LKATADRIINSALTQLKHLQIPPANLSELIVSIIFFANIPKKCKVKHCKCGLCPQDAWS